MLDNNEIVINIETREKIVSRVCRKEKEMFLKKELGEKKQVEEIRNIVETILKDEAKKI